MIQRSWASIDPIFSVDDQYLACNNPGTPPPSYISIHAGDTITAVYWYWLHALGPMTVWLARCGGDETETETDCRDVDVNQVRWFKIWEAGLLEGPNLAEGLWYQKEFQNWDGKPDLWPVTIPKGLKPGLYMIRHEILSIHVENKPQFYPECAHLNVTGGGDLFPPEEFLVRFPGVYDKDGESFEFEFVGREMAADMKADPSINIDVYAGPTANSTVSELDRSVLRTVLTILQNYTIPGGRIWDG
jgi:hypothetical protein